MERRILLILVCSAMLSFIVSHSNAQILFHADFENNEGPNDIEAWERVSPDALIFSVEDGVVKQTGNEIAHTTKVLVPVNGSNWTDYTVAVDRWWRDNDVLGLVFRYTDENAYYSFLVGAGDWDNNWCLAKTFGPEESDVGLHFEDGQSADKVLLIGTLEAPINEAGGVAYTMAVNVSGDTIEAFFGTQVDVLAGDMPPSVGEVTDNSFSKGTAGIYIESCPSDFDNFVVLGSAGSAVNPKGKLAATWASIRVW